jgi:hypothetical protein
VDAVLAAQEVEADGAAGGHEGAEAHQGVDEGEEVREAEVAVDAVEAVPLIAQGGVQVGADAAGGRGRRGRLAGQDGAAQRLTPATAPAPTAVPMEVEPA